MWQTILVVLLVAACAAYLLRRVVRGVKGADKGCGCGHTACGSDVIPQERMGKRQELIQLGAGESSRRQPGE